MYIESQKFAYHYSLSFGLVKFHRANRLLLGCGKIIKKFIFLAAKSAGSRYFIFLTILFQAGITTTLNARTAVLAAANPAFGRYNTSFTPQENMNLPAALLSRFDLMWLLLDRPDSDSDTALAHHVLHVHREGMPPVRIPEFRMISYLTLKS